MQTVEAYNFLFTEYPDVVNVKQMCEMLGGISNMTGYGLLRSDKIKSFTIGRCVRIPKIHIIGFIVDKDFKVEKDRFHS